ncbi:MAG: DPP IV N-terminal domain-containing protein [Bacteroidetes bacterium]|nr:DPP IV N-terminal domain-containing protein [Bacteroidota bacterium]
MKKLIILFFLSGMAKAQSLEQFLSYPKEHNLVASADGKCLAWVINNQGIQNIMIKVGIDQPKAFTDFQLDDGEDIAELSFSSNGSKLVFVKGNTIYYKGLTSQFSPLKITEGSHPVFYPDGLKLMFVKNGQLYETNLEVNPEVKALGQVVGINSDLKLSPSKNDLLFTATSGVGIFQWPTQKVKWLTPSNGVNQSPCWSPDGKQIAFFKIQDAQKGIALCVADVSSLGVKEIWTSTDRVSEFITKGISKPIYWASANQILFYSEHTGWRHIYSVKPDGSGLKDVTPGDGEADNFSIDSFAQNIYFSSNKEDAERRHIWKSNLTVENVTQLTKAPGIETDPTQIGPFLYCFRSTANSPSALTRVDAIRKTTLSINPSKQAAPNYFVKPETIVVPSSGESLGGQLFIDRMLNGKRIPLVFIHGGRQQMFTGFHQDDSYSDFYAFNQYLASVGYAVVAVNYRGSTGKGTDFRTNDITKATQDVVAAAKYLQLLPEVDKSKIGVFGFDEGSFPVQQALANNSDLIKAGVCIQFTGKGTPTDISGWTSPVLLVSSEANPDTNELVKKLKAKNISVDILTMPTPMAALPHINRLKIFKGVQDFFDKKLKSN